MALKQGLEHPCLSAKVNMWTKAIYTYITQENIYFELELSVNLSKISLTKALLFTQNSGYNDKKNFDHISGLPPFLPSLGWGYNPGLQAY